MAASGRLVLALVVFATAYSGTWTLVGNWLGWLDDVSLASGAEVVALLTAIATLSNLAAWTSRSVILSHTPFRTVATVQVLAAVLSISAQFGLTAVIGSLPRLMDPVLVVLAVSWMFLGPALITRAVFRVLAGAAVSNNEPQDASG